MSLLQHGSNALFNQAFSADALTRQDLAFASNATIKASQNASISQALQPNAKASVSFKTKNPLSLSLYAFQPIN
jgi:hypothetical protein